MRQLIIFLGVFAASIAHAADCGLIRDHDARLECYAEQNHDESECNLMEDRDMQRLCQERAQK